MTNSDTPTDCSLCEWLPDDPDYVFLHETEYWRIVLAPNQSLLGRCVVSLKRHSGDLADQTPEEVLDWLNILQLLEKSLRLAFDATMFNWSCYMNHAYRESPPAPHIHWWAVPRYNHPVHFENKVFEDAQFGNPYHHDQIDLLPKELHHQIAEKLKVAINKSLSKE